MKNSFESNLIKIPAKEVMDELYGKPPSRGEKDIAEFRKKNIKKPEKELFENLKDREAESLEQFFGTEIEVPDLPEEITPERYQEWKNMKFELHFIPEMDMTQDKKYPGWKIKPNWLFKYIEERKVNIDATKLKVGWILIDERAKPEPGKEYEDDPFKDTIKRLREKESILMVGKGEGSRFNISDFELQNEKVKMALAEILKVKPTEVHLPRAMEWNFLGNAYYKEWGDTSTLEWLEDRYGSSWSLLAGGDSNRGGLSCFCENSSNWSDNVGFRPLVRFPEK